jgi:iron complex outermembrane receptor protein
VSLRGRWNKSFQAPSLVQISQESQPSVTPFPGILTVFDPLLLKPGVPNPGLLPILAIQGTDSPLLPQKARDYNLGIDISPPFIDGLNLHLTYYNINYSGQIGTPPLGFGQFYNVPGFQNLYIINPTQAEAQTFLANAGVPSSLIAQAIAGALAQGGTAANIAYVVADVRALNIAVTKTDGFDFGFDFHHPVSFGSIDASFNGSLSKTSLTAADGTNYQPDQAGIDGTDFGSVAKIGVNVGDNFSGQLTWNHKAGFTLSVPAQLGQLKVGAFDTFDLFMKYDVTRGGLPPITLSLGINNLFDKGPPIYRGNGNGAFAAGYANGSTIGRLVQLGASVKF